MEAGYEDRSLMNVYEDDEMVDNEKNSYVRMLLQTLEKQEVTLQEVLEITKEQSAIANGQEFDEDAFGDTLNRKEVLIARLNTLDDGFASVYGRVRSVILEQKGAYKDEILKMQEYIKKCTNLGTEIKVLEERNRDKLMQCFSEKQKQYGSQLNAATVASKYHQTMRFGQDLSSRYDV